MEEVGLMGPPLPAPDPPAVLKPGKLGLAGLRPDKIDGNPTSPFEIWSIIAFAFLLPTIPYKRWSQTENVGFCTHNIVCTVNWSSFYFIQNLFSNILLIQNLRNLSWTHIFVYKTHWVVTPVWTRIKLSVGKKKHKNTQNTWVVWPVTCGKKHIKHTGRLPWSKLGSN